MGTSVQTIVAVATAPAAGGIGVLRLSGPAALDVGLRHAPDVRASPDPRHAYFSRLCDAQGGIVDEGLFLFFQGPRSFTGEDVVELHTHGSPRVLSLLQSELLKDGRLRLAEPGEFSRRAFLNGRMDLTKAEAVADLVAAESEAAVRSAAAQVRGALSEKVKSLRTPLLELHADLEGVLNFPDEAEEADAGAADRIQSALRGAQLLLEEAGRGRLVRRGARVVLYGPVNAGKSTLFNQLLGEARALVDDEPGTARDVLEARLELSGLGVTLIDTAGLRDTPGRIEALGIARAQEALASADLCVLVVPPEATLVELNSWRALAEGRPLTLVESKRDVTSAPVRPGAVGVSGRTGSGVALLRETIAATLWESRAPESTARVSERHAEALRRAVDSLERASSALAVSTLEVVSGEVGLALGALGEITGENVSDALLDAIFQRFCIGK